MTADHSRNTPAPAPVSRRTAPEAEPAPEGLVDAADRTVLPPGTLVYRIDDALSLRLLTEQFDMDCDAAGAPRNRYLERWWRASLERSGGALPGALQDLRQLGRRRGYTWRLVAVPDATDLGPTLESSLAAFQRARVGGTDCDDNEAA